jgi:KaiC/GvpD/RAD55 family RecA-like ATPase
MNTLDAHGVLRSHLLRGKYAARKSGKSLAFRCPRHNDATASAWLGDHAWGCSACGFTEGLSTLAEELGVEIPAAQSSPGLTIYEYAERKGLALDQLTKAGVEERTGKYNDPMVAIPYRDASGRTIRTKCRTRKGTFWLPDGEGTPLYGQDVLARTPVSEPVLIVEGESDCHAGWQRGLCVVGLPGASMWKHEYATLLAGRTVYVWQEPDEGGATLVSAVAKSLPKALVLKEVQRGDTLIKDLCDLHQAVQQLGEDWDAVWRTVLDSATPIGAEGPAVAFDSISGATLATMLEEKLAPIDAVPTPLAILNSLCRSSGGGVGFARGWVVTAGANTGNGKSLFAVNLAGTAILHGEVVTYITLEMGRSELGTRLLSVVSGESISALEQGPDFDAIAYGRASQSLDSIRRQTGGHVLVNRRQISRLQDVIACIKHYAETYGSRYFIIDYLQLIYTTGSQSINERMETVSHQLRETALQHNAVLVNLSQFNRQTSADRSLRPVAQGLMGGSAIENDSHLVCLFDHSRYEKRGNLADTWLIVDKNRHGGVADIPVQWDYRTLRITQRVMSIDEQEKKHGSLTRYGRAL